MTSVRRQARMLAAADREAKEIPWGNTNAPTFTLNRQIAQARREMGAARWAELNREWNT